MKTREFATGGLRRKAFWFSAVFVGLCAAVLTLMLRYDVPTDRLASIQRLVEQFDAVVFYNDFEPGVSRPRLYKWRQPVMINLKGVAGAKYKNVVKTHASVLSRLAGLPFLVFQNSDESGNVILHFDRRSSMMAIMSAYHPDQSRMEEIVNSAACLLFRWQDLDAGATSRAVAMIPSDYEPEHVSECVLEELTHSFGLPHNSELVHPSVFAAEDTPNQQLTLNDKILVRTLYDERITPGMPRAEALVMARTVITELVAKVKAEGETALYQQLKYKN